MIKFVSFVLRFTFSELFQQANADVVKVRHIQK